MNSVNVLKAIFVASVVVVCVAGCGVWGDSGSSSDRGVEAVVPRPPPHQPIGGDMVTLAEARERTPYTIPVPPQSVVGADLVEVWASRADRPSESKKVYLKYSNGLKISIGASIEDMDYGDADLLDGTFKAATVRGIRAIGKDPYIETTSIGTQANIIGSLSWWVNQVDISLYHPTLTMQELVTIAEAMPDPVWDSGASG